LGDEGGGAQGQGQARGKHGLAWHMRAGKCDGNGV
jgi:hypothetical protein